MDIHKRLLMAPAGKGDGGGGGAKTGNVSTAMDDALSVEDLATRGGEEDLEADTKGADRGDVVEGAEGEEEEGEEGGDKKKGAAKKDDDAGDGEESEEEEGDDKKAKKGAAKKDDDAGDGEEEEEEEEPDPKAKKGKADAEGEEEEEEEEPDPKAKKDDKGKKGTGPMIPKSRYDSLRARFDKAMERLEKQDGGEAEEEGEEEEEDPARATKGKADPIKTIDERLEAIDDEIEKAQDDNDKAKVKALRKEERKLNTQRTDIMVRGATSQASRAAVEQSRYDAAVEAVEETFPWINPDNKDHEDPAQKFNPRRAREVREMVAAFESAGHPPTRALMKAMKYFSDDRAAPKGDDAGDEDEGVRDKEKGAKKRKTDVERNLGAEKKTPPSMRKSGSDSDKAGPGKEGKIDVGRLSDEEFAKLPESTKARLRGDEG